MTMSKSLLVTTALAGGLMVAMPALAQTAATPAKPAAAPAKPDDGKEIIVTGVFRATAIERTPIAVNVVTNQQIQQHAAVSAADLLKNVPGVFVNSALGEIRNVVFSRGVSANSLDAAGGYYYVSLQEDGLPVELATATNYGPDYFLRADLNLNSLEALRGGTAAITGPNAPGGIFNYIQRTGKSHPGVELQGRFGLEGNGQNPYYRGDFYAGGKLSDSMYYSIGGFYRTDRGAHDPGYAHNKGGQIHGNLLYDYGNGSVLFTGKYLNDHNGWFEFTPAIGGTSIAPGFSTTSSVLPPASGKHCGIPIIGGSGTECWDPTSLVHSQSLAFGMNWHHEFDSGFQFENKMRYSHNKADWNTGAVISVVPITDLIVSFIDNTAFLPGSFNYTFHDTGKPAASVNAFFVNPGPPFPIRVVTSNNLPNQNLLANGVLTQAALIQHFTGDNFVDQATFTKDMGTHHLALGGYLALAKLSNTAGAGGFGLSTLTNQPQMLNVTYTDPGGKVYQVTDPSGFTGMGSVFGGSYHGTQNQFSVFFGDTWKATPELSIEAGGRYEHISYDITNQTYNSSTNNILTAGGTDGNPLTLYDNLPSTVGPAYNVKRSYNLFNYSASVAYQFSDHFNAYVRFTNGKKAPDFGTIAGINTPAAIATQFPKPQGITQLEMGLKYHTPNFDFQAFPFYSHLTNVITNQTFTYTSGARVGQFYAPPPVAGEITTYGVEVSARAALSATLAAHANVTLQSPKAKNFGSYTQGPKGDGTDDVLNPILPGDADNNPKVIIRAGFDWKPVAPLNLFAEINHIGARAANSANAFYLPAYTTVDAGVTWNINAHLKAQFNVTNLFNQLGVLSWSRSGAFLDSLDRQGLTKAQYQANANGLYPIVPTQARAFFWTLTAKF